jgi:hypothetical protein
VATPDGRPPACQRRAAGVASATDLRWLGVGAAAAAAGPRSTTADGGRSGSGSGMKNAPSTGAFVGVH